MAHRGRIIEDDARVPYGWDEVPAGPEDEGAPHDLIACPTCGLTTARKDLYVDGTCDVCHGRDAGDLAAIIEEEATASVDDYPGTGRDDHLHAMTSDESYDYMMHNTYLGNEIAGMRAARRWMEENGFTN